MNGRIVTPRDRMLLDIREVAALHDIDADLVLSGDRHYPVTMARAAAMYVLHRKYGLSLKRIGGIFGRDHSTVHHALARHLERTGKLDHVRVQALRQRRERERARFHCRAKESMGS